MNATYDSINIFNIITQQAIAHQAAFLTLNQSKQN